MWLTLASLWRPQDSQSRLGRCWRWCVERSLSLRVVADRGQSPQSQLTRKCLCAFWYLVHVHSVWGAWLGFPGAATNCQDLLPRDLHFSSSSCAHQSGALKYLPQPGVVGLSAVGQPGALWSMTADDCRQTANSEIILGRGVLHSSLCQILFLAREANKSNVCFRLSVLKEHSS